MTVGELLSRMSSRELTEWQALVKIEAWERQQAENKAKAQAKRGRRR